MQMSYMERRARRLEWLAREREWLAREQEAAELRRAERRARNEPRREFWHAVWRDARPVLRLVLVLIALAVCGALAF
jgi:hypothetical protein